MTSPAAPFQLPQSLEPELQRAHDYWRGLIRGANDMPFWDDVRPTSLPGMGGRLMLIETFDKPWRFRLGSVVGAEIEQRYGGELRGFFVDKIDPHTPLEALNAQCAETVRAQAPSFYRHESAEARYSRLLLPMWGDGRIGMLLCAFLWR